MWPAPPHARSHQRPASCEEDAVGGPAADRGGGGGSLGGALRYTKGRFDPACDPACRDELAQAWVLDLAKGQERRITDMEHPPFGFDWSPDGRRVAYSAPVDPTVIGNGSVSIALNDFGVWIMDADGGNQRLVTTGASPRWSPDSSRLVLGCGLTSRALCLVDVDGTGRAEIPGTSGMWGADWAPDGTVLAANRNGPLGYEGVILGLDGTVERVIPSVTGVRWSADGASLAAKRMATFSSLDTVCLPEPCGTYPGIWLVDRDGTNLRRVTTGRYDQGAQFAR